jgi:hypothetical protein
VPTAVCDLKKPFIQQMGWGTMTVTAVWSTNCSSHCFLPSAPGTPAPPTRVTKLPASACLCGSPSYPHRLLVSSSDPGDCPHSGVTEHLLSSSGTISKSTVPFPTQSQSLGHESCPHLTSLPSIPILFTCSFSMPKGLELNFPPGFILWGCC